MFDELDRRTRLTGNQIKILIAAIIGDALEFFDYFLIGFVLAFLIGPWNGEKVPACIAALASSILATTSGGTCSHFPDPALTRPPEPPPI